MKYKCYIIYTTLYWSGIICLQSTNREGATIHGIIKSAFGLMKQIKAATRTHSFTN